MEGLSSILDVIVGDRKARKPSISTLAPKVAMIAPQPEDFTEMCEHGTSLTCYMHTAIYALPGSWHSKYGVPKHECIYTKHQEYFQDLDARCRAIHKASPQLTVREVLARFI